MKGKSLFKKIAAAATTVAMLASVSVVGFAAPEDGNADNFVSTNKVTGAVGFTENTTTNAFDFVVDYTQNSTTDNIGVTMLAYKVGTGDEIANGYTGTGTNVVGIAQNGSAEATKKFTFSVAKGTGERELTYGDDVIVLLSSDGAANAVGYLKKITGTTDKVVLNDTAYEVTLPYYDARNAAEVKAALEDVDNLNVDVTIGEGTTENVNAVGVTEVGTPVFADDAWTVEVTLEAIAGESLSVAAGKKLTVPVTVTKAAWTATSATMANDIIPYDAEAEITTADAMLTAITNLVKDGSHKITFKGDDEHEVAVDVPATATVAWKGEAPTEITQGGSYTVTVTLAEELTLDDEVAKAPVSVVPEFTVTYQADTRKEITSAAAYKDTTKVEALADYDISKGTAASNVIAYVETLIDSYEITDGEDTAAGKKTAIALYNEAGTDAVETVAKDETYTVKITVVAADDVATAWKGSAVIELSIDVVEAPAFECGDVNHDGRVNNKDAVAIMDYVDGKTEGFYVEQADTLKDDKVNNKDAVTIMDFVDHVYDSLPVVK